MPILGIPLWVWITGGAVAVGTTGAIVADQTGDAAEQMGDAAAKSAELAKWVVVGGALYVAYRAAKTSGAIK